MALEEQLAQWSKKWDENKQFRDPVYGYVQIPVPYVKNLVDTSYMQRIKGVAQSGLRPLFSAANHERFSHSVGVYRFAMLLYDSLEGSARSEIEHLAPDTKKRLGEKLGEWRNLLAIACLLHDIGHPVQSHSMEFLYDDVFLDFPQDWNGIQTFDEKEMDRIANQYLRARSNLNFRKPSPFYEAMREEKRKINNLLSAEIEEWKKQNKKSPYRITVQDTNYQGNPHERMSAYYILKDGKLRKSIDELCNSYAVYKLERAEGYKDDLCKESDNVDFICRMITGTRYRVSINDTDGDVDLEFSLRNCVISILNGTIDADSMDYIMRNSYSAGYETSGVDHHRFCGAFTVYYENRQFFPAWRKSALSVIGGFITARNYEPKWLYSHHKVVYQDILVKEMLMDAVKYIAQYGLPKETRKAYQTKCVEALKEDLAKRTQDSGFLPEESAKNERVWSYQPFFSYVLSPFVPFSNGAYTFFRSIDGDIDSFFKRMDLEMQQREPGTEEERELIQEYRALYQEYCSRKHKHSLWKSFAEYKQAITSIAKRLDTDFETINGYVLELIREGLSKKQFQLDIDDDNGEAWPSKFYKHEIIYYPQILGELDKKNRVGGGERRLIIRGARAVFGDFRPETCRVKIIYPKTKDFSREQVWMDGHHYNLSELLDWDKSELPQFPYLFFSEEGDVVSIRKRFFQRLEVYCRQRITAIPVGGTMFNQKDGKVIRDVVHGDIFLPKKYMMIVDTPEFQRLRSVRQLATAAQVFPNADHSRFSHSLGTYYVMGQIIDHFENLCENQGMTLFHNERERDVVLLSALLHDLGHGPYSHAFEHVLDKDHEQWTWDIILDNTTIINQALCKNFGEDMPRLVVDCLNHQVRKSDVFSFADIYPTLISSQLDADRLDYLLRDSYNTAIQFGRVDLQNLIAAMRITVIGQKYTVAIDEGYLAMVEHFLFGRFKMYETVYFNAYKLFTEELFERIFRRAKELYAQSPESLQMRSDVFQHILNGDKLSISDYLRLDDIEIEAQFRMWQQPVEGQEQDELLKDMIQAFMFRNRENSDASIYRRVRVFYERDAEVQDLLRQIASVLKKRDVRLKICDSQEDGEESYAFINMVRNCRMYQGAERDESGEDAAEGKNTIWLLLGNGTVRDIGKVSRMLSDKFHKSYLYYSRDIFAQELKMLHKDAEAEDIVKEVEKLLDSADPRHMIEIEEKYTCDETTLRNVEQLLSGFIKDKQSGHEGFYLMAQASDGCVWKDIEQTDIYYDTSDGKLQKANCTLRCRKLSDKCIFTIKRPTNSINFGGNEQFARFEFELTTESEEITPDVLEFIKTRLEIEVLLKKDDITDEEIINTLRPILSISNSRKRGIVCRCVENGEISSFKAEVCLDNISYQKSGTDDVETKERDWQIEVELKSDYLDRILLKKFTNLIREHEGMSERLRSESKSKYQNARDRLGLNRTPYKEG